WLVAAHRRRRSAWRTVDAIAQLFPGPKEQSAFGLHRDDLPGLGVTSLISLIILHVERAEPADLDVFAAAERLLHRLEDRLDGRFRLLLCNPALRHENVDQVGLEHSLSPASAYTSEIRAYPPLDLGEDHSRTRMRCKPIRSATRQYS